MTDPDRVEGVMSIAGEGEGEEGEEEGEEVSNSTQHNGPSIQHTSYSILVLTPLNNLLKPYLTRV